MRVLNIVVALQALLLAGGCASIVSDSNYPVRITSSPGNATFTITDEHGKVVHSGTTPETVTLRANDGYFDGMTYEVSFEKSGHETYNQTFSATTDGWYFGNILLGGLIGILIVDPATGAMYKLPKEVGVKFGPDRTIDETLETDEEAGDEIQSQDDSELQIMSLDQLSIKERTRLIKIL